MTARRLALSFWIVLLAAVGVRVLVSNPHSQSVVPIYTTAGERWQAGTDIYAPVWSGPDLPAWGQDLYRNPPGFAAAFAPLTKLPDRAAGVVWRMIGVGLFLAGLWRFVSDVVPLSPNQKAWAFFAAGLLTIPSLNNGQVNVHLAGAILLGAAATARGNLWTAAAWLAAAAWLKLYPVAGGMLVCLVLPRLAPRFAVALGVGFAVPFLFQTPEFVLDQYRSMARLFDLDDRSHTVLWRASRDWTILPRAHLGVVPDRTTADVVGAVAGLMCAGVVWKKRDVATATGLGLVWMTLFGPATENPTYTLLAPIAAVAVVTNHRSWPAWAAFALLLLPVLRGLFPPSELFPLRTAQPVAAGLLAVSLCWPAVVRTHCPGLVVGVGRVPILPPRSQSKPARLSAKRAAASSCV